MTKNTNKINQKSEKMTLGKIIATEETPTPTKVHFVTDKDLVDKDQYIKFNSSQGKVIGRIEDLHKTNRYFDSPESITQIEKTGIEVTDKFPTEEWEHTVGEVKALGIYKENKIERPTKPPAPGTEVKEPKKEVLRDFLGLEKPGEGLEIGELQHHGITSELSLTDLFQKHLAVLAQTGAGKTYTVSVLMEELLERQPEEGRIASIVIDVHGEYRSLAQSERYKNKVKIVNGKDFNIPVRSLDVSDFKKFLPGMRKPQERELSSVIEKLRYRDEPYEIEDIIKMISKDDDIHEEVQRVLPRWLNKIKGDLFSKTGSSVRNLVKPGQLTVLDLSDLIKSKKRGMITSYIAERLFNARRKEKVPPFVLFVEEAHNFAKEGVEKEENIPKGIIETISREGRKFGASICLVSQRPMKLSTTALSQCNTQLIMRITNPNDLDHITKTSEGIDEKSRDSITTLRVGESLLLGEAVNHPVFLNIRKRYSEEAELGENLEEQAKKYEEEINKRSKDAEAFM